MSYYLSPANFKGAYRGVPSKSITQRVLFLSTLLDEFVVYNPLWANDIKETITVLTKLGFEVTGKEDAFFIKKQRKIESAEISLLGSATTLRFVIPFAFLHLQKLTINLSENLQTRFNDIYGDIFQKNDISYQNKGNKIIISGSLKGGKYQIPETVSSQFISGLLLTLPFLKEDSELILPNKTPSFPYVNLTVELLEELGVRIEKKENSYLIKGQQKLLKNSFIVENDYSQAAYFFVLKELGENIIINNLKEDSFQGDKEVVKILTAISSAKKGDKPLLVDLYHYPDLAPILFVYTALSKKEIIFKGLNNLKHKESNRLQLMITNLRKVGQRLEYQEESLHFYPSILKGGIKVETANDHRLIMSLAVLASFLKEGLYFDSLEGVNKSYPNFFSDFTILGGKISVT